MSTKVWWKIYAYKFSNRDNNKSILLLQKRIDSYEYMDDWEKFNETSLPKKEDSYNYLDIEDITGADYAYAKSWFVFSKLYIIVSWCIWEL